MHHLPILLVIASLTLPFAVHAESKKVRRGASDSQVVAPKDPTAATKKPKKTLKKAVANSKKLLQVKPDFTVKVSPPAHKKAPAKVKVTNLGSKPPQAVRMKVDLKRTCDGKFVANIAIGFGHDGNYILTKFNNANQDTIEVIPNDGKEWKYTPGCSYSIAAFVDHDKQIAEKNENNNKDTAYYGGQP